MSRGAQLHHFPSKQALVVGAVEHLTERRRHAMADTVPPSIVLIVLGSVAGVSIAGLFNAGFLVAGVLLALLRWREGNVALPRADIGPIAGLGLGLYIARQVVLAHRGTIRVESELGHGATFIVELPLAALA